MASRKTLSIKRPFPNFRESRSCFPIQKSTPFHDTLQILLRRLATSASSTTNSNHFYPRRLIWILPQRHKQTKVRLGVGAFILESSNTPSDNPRFLIGKRIGSHGAGTWGLPGGALEPGETLEAGAEREVYEETGLKVSAAKGVQFMTTTTRRVEEDDTYYMIIMIFVACVRNCEHEEPIVMEPEKCEKWEWNSWKDLVRWIEAQEQGEGSGGSQEGNKEIFLPLTNLVKQRPDLTPAIV